MNFFTVTFVLYYFLAHITSKIRLKLSGVNCNLNGKGISSNIELIMKKEMKLMYTIKECEWKNLERLSLMMI